MNVTEDGSGCRQNEMRGEILAQIFKINWIQQTYIHQRGTGTDQGCDPERGQMKLYDRQRKWGYNSG